jgi:hypothetical protein
VRVAFVLRASFDIGSNSINSAEDAALFIYAGTLTASNVGSLPRSLLHLSWRDHRLALRLEANLAEWCSQEPAVLDNALSETWKGFTRGEEWQSLESVVRRPPLSARGPKAFTAKDKFTDFWITLDLV